MYQRGAHSIWEVDGAHQKVCRPLLSLLLGFDAWYWAVVLSESCSVWEAIHRRENTLL